MDAITKVPAPVNEPPRPYTVGSPDRAALEPVLKEIWETRTEITNWIDGRPVAGGGDLVEVVAPFEKSHVLGTFRNATAEDTAAAIAAAKKAAPAWAALSIDDRAAILLKAADLLTGSWRAVTNAVTMLGQAKTIYQAEIDAVCELADFWRFNAHFARQIYAEQPAANSPGIWNRLDHRPLEGFVYAITPFNFTSIAANLATAPALMGNTVIWKPSPTQALSAEYTMRMLRAAGLPPGVINLVHGAGPEVSSVALADPDLAGIHFTGSTATFQHLWSEVGSRITEYRSYPRIVGETGGKDFVLAHPSADVDVLRTALVRGAFEYSGQKCSAASRAYVPRSVWTRLKDGLADVTSSLPVGPPTDFANFTSAVIDERAFAKHKAALARAASAEGVEILAGGKVDDSVGYFVEPTVLVVDDPADEALSTEYFGPILAVHVFEDEEFDAIAASISATSKYALTGAIIAQDRQAVAAAAEALRFAAGNFYINDKPTGAVVGQQPFGGARASGTNDKAGAPQNLQRWTSTRSIKETFEPAVDWRYPHMG
ncbi:L-glutamate gamma-semialdehyde dehydrogenase [Kineosporia babensis]|uniref:L-glutamate gamma-semialdehyde dehydrogenase n=1 Tax=Kineosporia babensis TaxID=499548 RepID=A0A9X1NH49_9ACTN|nr:L-glutamate gamma-semialdehyde dehydrogenase [Kineosporia babensis]MCD5313176.1 L-glutamate gamma-semialdehyde dehydrogenase [Kineosporia babensis]